jgi:hypothetical protein
VDYLQTRENMAFNGVVLVSVALDLEAIFDWPGNDRPYALFVPTYAATSYFHRALPTPPADLQGFLQEVRAWSLGPYTSAFDVGRRAQRQRARCDCQQATPIHRALGGLHQEGNLRVSEGEYTKELLREHRETIGRLDSRFTGVTFDPLAQNAASILNQPRSSGAYTSAYLDLFPPRCSTCRGNRDYVITARAFEQWDWKHRVPR